MYFHAPCGVVLYCFVCKLYANKEKKKIHVMINTDCISKIHIKFSYTFISTIFTSILSICSPYPQCSGSLQNDAIYADTDPSGKRSHVLNINLSAIGLGFGCWRAGVKASNS